MNIHYKHLLLLLTFTFVNDLNYAQQSVYSKGLISFKNHIEVLSHDSLFGRGYQFQGHLKAARYIETEFQKLGYETRRLRFSFPANLFPNTPVLILNQDTLQPGIDYLPSSDAPSIDTILKSPERTLKNETLLIKNDSLSSAWSEKKQTARMENADLVMWEREKMMFSTARHQASTPIVYIRPEFLNQIPDFISVCITSEIQTVETYNIYASLPGDQSDQDLFFTAHYDHLGALGREVIFNGANDNASGTAYLLYLAEIYSSSDTFDPHFIAFSGEEAGLRGALDFYKSQQPVWSQAELLLNFDMVTSGDGSIGVVGANDYPAEYEQISHLADQMEIRLRPRSNSPISDHYFFLDSGIPGFYIYTSGGGQPYHHIQDDFSTLNFDAFEKLQQLMELFIAQWPD